MLNRKWLSICGAAVLFLVLPLAVIFRSETVFAAAEGADEDSPKAAEVAQNLGSKRAKSPEITIKEMIYTQIPRPTLPEGRTLIKQINVIGSTLLAQEAIDKLKADYENLMLSGREIQRCADLVTRAYNREGYITSYGYVVPDKLAEGVLDIMVKEGRTGKITIEGNKNFSTELLMKKITLKEGDYFNFRQLANDVYRINKHPDRKLAIACDPNIETGITNVTLTAKDKSPMHATLQMDNYGSEYIGYKRHKIYLLHNNISGHDDSLQVKLQMTEANAHKLFDFDYYLPLNNDWKLNLYYMPYKREDYLHGDNVDNDFEKHAHKWYFWFIQSLVDRPDFEMSSSYGYVQKDIHWWEYGRQQKSDLFRALMWGIDFNKADRYGRWVISNDLEIGLPRLFGGSTAEDDSTSVSGAGSKYKKNHLIVARRQKLFAGIDFITKGHWQVCNQALTGVNVFSVGGFMGVIDNRGFPRAQAPGDEGRSLSAGFSLPPFGVPRTLTVPFSKTKLYDDLRFFTFVDYARASFKTAQPDEPKHQELTSGGCGFEFKVPDKAFSVRLDIGWPLSDQMPNDGDHAHTWFSVTKGY